MKLTTLRRLRLERGLHQADIASLTLGAVPQWRLSDYERGLYPSKKDAEVLSTVFGVPIAEIWPELEA